MSEIGTVFVSRSRRYLTSSYLPKLERTLATLSDEDVWWRPNAASNSIGNLALHLAGSLRYWVASVAGGASSDRVRDEEFAATGGLSRDELVEILRAAVAEADEVLAGFDGGRLAEWREGEEYAETALEAIYHAVEHFSMHTGQILQLAKMRIGEDLDLEDLS
jgi:uncharacterized damage-inducible protein DinB